MKLAACDMSVTNPGASAVPLPPPSPAWPVSSATTPAVSHQPLPPSFPPGSPSYGPCPASAACPSSRVTSPAVNARAARGIPQVKGSLVMMKPLQRQPVISSEWFFLSPTTARVLLLALFFFFLVGEPKRGCLGGDKPTKMTREFSRWRINDPFDGPSVLRTSYRSEDNELLYWKRSRRRRRKRGNRQSSNRSMNNE